MLDKLLASTCVMMRRFVRRAREVGYGTALLGMEGRRRAIKAVSLSVVLTRVGYRGTASAQALVKPKPEPVRPLMRRPASGVAPTGLRLNSPTSQVSVPLVCSAGGIVTPVACAFGVGEVIGQLVVVNQPKLHVVPLAKWNDGSLKHCAI